MNPLSKKSPYPFVLDHKPGFFLSRFLYRLFKRVRFDENMIEQLKQMHREGTVVYAMKYKGHLDYLLYHYRFRRSRLPYPKIAFHLNMSMLLPFHHIIRVLKFYTRCLFKDGRLPNPFETGFFKEAIKQGTTALFCLVDPKGFTRHFIHAEKEPIHFLLEVQKEMDRPIYLVPLLILYKKTPEKDYSTLLDIFFGFKDNPGFIRKIALFFRHNRRAFIDFGKPLNLMTCLKDQPAPHPLEQTAAEIRQAAIENIDRQKRVILGPIMKSRQQVKEKVLKDRDVIHTIESIAERDIKRLKQLKKQAGAYFNEIAADYNPAYIQFFLVVLTWLWKKVYQGIDVEPAEMAVVREWARRGPVIYIPSHKSHVDYLAINYVLYNHQMHIPRVAAGKNLTFWPMGHMFRKSGAFFIRRTFKFKGAKLYTKVFAGYIKALLEESHSLEFFIEGGRSRSGKLIQPKVGLLSILLQAYGEGCCDDLIFMPASISYDRIMEEKSYLKELGGGEKKQEDFKQILKARRFLKRKYGKIYIRFGQPISLKDYLTEKGGLGKETHRDLAFHLIRSINKVTLATPLALVASAILARHRRGFHLHELTATTETLLRFLKHYEIPTATSLDHPEKTVEETLSLLINNKVANVLEDVNGTESFYYVDEEKKKGLEYYKNNVIHCLISHALVAVSLLTGAEEIKTGEAIRTDYGFLKNLFQNEFVFNVDKNIQEETNEITAYFLNASFITQNEAEGGFQLTRLGFDKLSIWAGLAKTFIESYWIVARTLMQQENKTTKQEDLLKDMSNLGMRFHKMGLIDNMESISHSNFKSALQFMNENVLQEQEKPDDVDSGGREKLSRISQRLHELSHYRA